MSLPTVSTSPCVALCEAIAQCKKLADQNDILQEEEARRARRRQEKPKHGIKRHPLPSPFPWAVPSSPTRDICLDFCAFADSAPNRAITGRKGHKQHQKNCANLCTVVQQLRDAASGLT